MAPTSTFSWRSTIDAILTRIKASASTLRLRALIVQPPDFSQISSETLDEHGFSRGPLDFVIRSTAVIDLSPGASIYLAQIRRSTRQEVRKARHQGTSIRVGNRADLRIFFALMAETCRRQKVAPNPSGPELLEALWDNFQPGVRLGLATVAGQVVAGLLTIAYGSRLTLWKKGWISRNLGRGVNALLTVEALDWAGTNGLQVADFAAMDPAIAESLLAGRGLSPAQRNMRDYFNLGLGAQPLLLPPARLWVPNRMLRLVVGLARRIPALQERLFRRLS